MIKYQEACAILRNFKTPLGTEKIPLDLSLNRVLAQTLYNPQDMPPFNKSAMDGFAIRKQDLPGPFQVIETIYAGRLAQKTVGPGECSKIMTGAMIPEGADTVIIIEETEKLPDHRIKYSGHSTRSHICYQGEDLKKGEVILNPGTLLKPQHIALAATTGTPELRVYRQPRVGVISTGDEIIEPGENITPGKIYNSNGLQITSQTRNCNSKTRYYGIAGDDEGSLSRLIAKAVSEQDILIISGGISMGELDLVPKVLEDLNYEILFQKIQIQPGKPSLFAHKDQSFIFGLPGNPVSSFIIFELLIKEFLYQLQGHSYEPINWPIELGTDLKRKKSDRLCWYPIQINPEDGKAYPLEYHGSGHLHGLNKARALLSMEIGVHELRKGETIVARLL